MPRYALAQRVEDEDEVSSEEEEQDEERDADADVAGSGEEGGDEEEEAQLVRPPACAPRGTARRHFQGPCPAACGLQWCHCDSSQRM